MTNPARSPQDHEWLSRGQARAAALANRWPELHAAVGDTRSGPSDEIRSSTPASSIPIDAAALAMLTRGEALAADLVWITCDAAQMRHPRIADTRAQWAWLGRALAHPALPTETARRTAGLIAGQLERVETFLGYRPAARQARRRCPACSRPSLIADVARDAVTCTNPNCKTPETGRPYRATLTGA